jgi:hypothetical protein
VLKLSIIVPADGHQEDLDNTLLSVLENRPADCQVIVPHPCTYRDPYDLGDEVTFVSSESAELATLINTAVRASEGEIVHVLLGRSMAKAGWTDAVMSQFAHEAETAAIAPAIIRPTNERRLSAVGIRYGRGGTKRLVAAGKTLRAGASGEWQIDGPLLQAAFIRRSVLDRLGGMRGDFGGYHIDTDLAARLRWAKATCVFQPESQVKAAVRPAPRGFQAARRAELLYWTHVRQMASAGAHSCHGVHVVGDLLRQFPRPSLLTSLLGRTVVIAQSLCRGGLPAELRGPANDVAAISIPIDQTPRQSERIVKSKNPLRRYSRTA